MSRESFSSKIASDILNRFFALEHYDPEKFLQMDETFQLALCITYMALSKESIILKDKKNMDRLGRLTRQVPESELDLMFIGPHSPSISATLENDSTWIVDNIRDSILHEHFDIDEERRVVVIHNSMYGRGLDAEIPFDWFYQYVENDILKKRFKDHYMVRGFYYDASRPSCMRHPDMTGPKKEKVFFSVYNHILYRVEFKGSQIPVHGIDERVHELFEKFALEDIPEIEKEYYKSFITDKDGLMNENYLISFYRARDKVLSVLQKEYPNCQIEITNDYHKHKLALKSRKKLLNSYENYDDLFHKMNDLLQRKGNINLKMISRLYDYSNQHLVVPSSREEQSKIINQIVAGDDYVFSSDKDSNFEDLRFSTEKLREAFLQIYGLCILAVNKKKLLDPKTLRFIEQNMHGYSKDSFQQYAINERKLLSRYFDLMIVYDEKKAQYDACPPEVKPMIRQSMDTIDREIIMVKEQIDYLEHGMNIIPIHGDILKKNHKPWEKYRSMVMKLSRDFHACPFEKENHGQNKKIIKELLLRCYDKAVEVESQYFLGETEPKETLEMVRNCFSHVGRIQVFENVPLEQSTIKFRDYDDQGDLAGMVQTNYVSFLSFLASCLGEEQDRDLQENKSLS